MNHIPVTFAPHPVPNAGSVICLRMVEGVTLAEIVAQVAPRDGWDTLCVHVNDWEAPQGSWHIVRPKMRGTEINVVVTRRLHGGGSKKGVKNTLSVVASIALIALATAATGGAFAMAGGLFAAGSMSAYALAGAITILGRYAMTQLTAPSARDGSAGSAQTRQLGSAGGEMNLIGLGESFTRVVGTRKVFPRMICEPLIEMIGDSEYIECVYALAGPHQVDDLKIEGAPVVDRPDIAHQIVEGRSGDGAQSMVSRYGKTDAVQVEMSKFEAIKETPWYSLDTSKKQYYPLWHVRTTALDPDEIWMHFLWPEGMGEQGADNAVNFRVRMRQVGTATWINLPEVAMRSDIAGPVRRQIKLRFGGTPTADKAYNNGGWKSWHTTAVPVNPAWQPGAEVWTADPVYVKTATPLTATNYVERTADGVVINLPELGGYVRGQKWEVAVKMSCVYSPDNAGNTDIYSLSGYTPVNDGRMDLFYPLTVNTDPPSSPTVYRKDIQTSKTTCLMMRFVSVKNDTPTPVAGDTHIAVAGKDINVQQVSCIASGLVPDWDGSTWTGLVATDNPAPHLRWVYAGTATAKPVPTDILDEGSLVDWRVSCATAGIKISAAFEGNSFDEVVNAIASVGYAKPRMTDEYGVFYDYDTSAEGVVQTFSTRNAANIVFEKSFDDLPSGMLVRFANEALNYEPDQIVVARPGVDPDQLSNLVTVDAQCITDQSQVEAQFAYNLAMMEARALSVSFDTDVQNIVCRMGSVIGLNHHIISRFAVSARVKTVFRNDEGEVVALQLDNVVQFGTATDFLSLTDVLTEPDLLAVGQELAASVALLDGTEITRTIVTSTEETDVITFTSPVPDVGFTADGYDRSVMVSIGPSDAVTMRLKVLKIEPKGFFDATITALPEAADKTVLSLNLLRNGDFKGGTAHWVKNGYANLSVADGQLTLDRYSFVFGSTFGGGTLEAFADQDVFTDPGQEYVLSFGVDMVGAARVTVKDESGTTLISSDYTAAQSVATLTFTATTATTKIKLGVYGTTSAFAYYRAAQLLKA